MRLKAALALLISAFFPSAALAASISDYQTDEGLYFIFLEGEIESGDEEVFRQFAIKHEQAVVILDSPGGAVIPALEMGKLIHLRGYGTAVIDEGFCVSACALMWLGGQKRLLSRSAQLGFHASYRLEDGRGVESGAANALVGQYLSQLNLSRQAILFATTAPPDKFLWLNDQTRAASGISFEFLGENSERVASNDSGAPIAEPKGLAPPQQPMITEFSKYPKWWLENRAAINGLDVTMDGKVWINADHYGDKDDYGVAASDLYGASGRFRKAWVRGYHARNPDVPYRESKRLVHADCTERRWGTELEVFYDAEGKLIDSYEASGWSPVVPSSHAENWWEMICRE